MRLIKRALPFLLLAAVATTALDGCFIFHGKNKCGDCPNFKTNNKPKKPKHH